MKPGLLFILQVRYREEGRKELPSCLFSSLTQTLDTEHTKEATALQSQVTPRCSSSCDLCQSHV